MGIVDVREQGQEFNRVVGWIDEVPHSPGAADRDRLGRIEMRADVSHVRATLLPDPGPGQEGHDHRSGRIGEKPPGPDFGVNVTPPEEPFVRP